MEIMYRSCQNVCQKINIIVSCKQCEFGSFRVSHICPTSSCSPSFGRASYLNKACSILMIFARGNDHRDTVTRKANIRTNRQPSNRLSTYLHQSHLSHFPTQKTQRIDSTRWFERRCQRTDYRRALLLFRSIDNKTCHLVQPRLS